MWKERPGMGETHSAPSQLHSLPARCLAVQASLWVIAERSGSGTYELEDLGQCFSNIILHSDHPGILLACRFRFCKSGGKALRLHISMKFPGDADGYTWSSMGRESFT